MQIYRVPGRLADSASPPQIEPIAVGATDGGQAAYAMNATHFTGTPGRFARARSGTIPHGSLGSVEGSSALRDDNLLARALAPCGLE